MSWRIGLSTGACTELPILEIVPALRTSGVAGVEVSTPPRHFDPWRDDQVDAVNAELRAVSIGAVSIHAPFGGSLDLADPNPHHRHATIGAVLMAASVIKRLGGRIVVVHPSDLPRNGHDAGARLADCVGSLTSLASSCRQEGLTLAVESPLPHLIGGHPDEFGWILRHLDDGVGVCLDTGHTALGGHWHQFVDVAGARLCHVHASDNFGRRDDHLPPGDGCLDWPEIRRTLEAAAFSGWIMLELTCPGEDVASHFSRAVAQAERLLGPSSHM